jgi:hypothetical protein
MRVSRSRRIETRVRAASSMVSLAKMPLSRGVAPVKSAAWPGAVSSTACG